MNTHFHLQKLWRVLHLTSKILSALMVVLLHKTSPWGCPPTVHIWDHWCTFWISLYLEEMLSTYTDPLPVLQLIPNATTWGQYLPTTIQSAFAWWRSADAHQYERGINFAYNNNNLGSLQ